MKATARHLSLLALLLALCCGGAFAAPAEHTEFEVTLHAPFPAPADARRTFGLNFSYPGLEQTGTVYWKLELGDPQGRTVQVWRGSSALTGQDTPVQVAWDGRLKGKPDPSGMYRVRMRAILRGVPDAHGDEHAVGQEWQIAVGARPAPRMPRFTPLPGVCALRDGAAMAPATGALSHTVYLANLHSQSNHSDGGAALDDCKGAQDPRTAKYGPEAVFAYARGRGHDIPAVSEHNHMYDGSEGTTPDAGAQDAKALYKAGPASAAAFNATRPSFLAQYGRE